jgi:phosphotriesterase-related protein
MTEFTALQTPIRTGSASPAGVREVQTAAGPIAVDTLGRTLMHEHLFVTSPEVRLTWPNYPESWDEEIELERVAAKLREAKAAGIDTLVDLTVFGLGRYVPRVAKLATRTAVNIVVATGAFVLNELPLYFHFRGPGTRAGGHELMTPLFVSDIEDGIGETGIRAAVLKCVTDEAGLTHDVDRVLRAVAQAHRQTGAPISTHTNAELRTGLDQQRIFAEEGVDLSRVIIGHSGDTKDYEYLEQLIDAGSYLGMDRFGLDTVPFADRVEIVAEMVRRGHADRMVLSHDRSGFSDTSDGTISAQRNPTWRWTHIPNDVLPALIATGVTQAEVDQMMIENPRRIFDHDGAY